MEPRDSLGWCVDGFARGCDSIGLGAVIVYGNCERRARSLSIELVARYNLRRANNSLDASGGSAFRNLLGAAEGALIRAAASTQPLGLLD